MATDLENLQTRRSAVLAELAALGPTKAGGLPNAGGDGIGLDHQGYKAGLYAELREIEALITALGGAFESTSDVYSG